MSEDDGDIGPGDDAGATILRCCGAVPRGRSVAPVTVARALAGEAWGQAMPAVRRAALALAAAGAIEIVRKGRALAPDAVRGVVRYRLPAGE